MATYKGIQGFAIQNLSSDPTDGNEGQVWYNSTSNVWKVQETTASASWASGGNMATGRNYIGSSGEQTAALAFGGGNTPALTDTEEYNGSSWSTGGAFPYGAISVRGTGTQTATLAVGGHPGSPTFNTNTSSYDGSTWTNVGTYPKGILNIGISGTTTAGLGAGGYSYPNVYNNDTHEFNGSTWTASGNLVQTQNTAILGGTQTDSISFTGISSPGSSYLITATEAYDGSTWTTLPATTSQGVWFSAGSGNSASASWYGGEGTPQYLTVSNLYDGTSWAVDASLPTGVQEHGGHSPSTSTAISFAGKTNPTTYTTATNEYNAAGAFTTKTITTS